MRQPTISKQQEITTAFVHSHGKAFSWILLLFTFIPTRKGHFSGRIKHNIAIFWEWSKKHWRYFFETLSQGTEKYSWKNHQSCINVTSSYHILNCFLFLWNSLLAAKEVKSFYYLWAGSNACFILRFFFLICGVAGVCASPTTSDEPDLSIGTRGHDR